MQPADGGCRSRSEQLRVGGVSPAEESVFRAGRRGGGCVCVCVRRVSTEKGTPLRSSLVATGCGMRRAEKTSHAAWFDSQTRAGAEDGSVWKSAHALRPSRGRKHANEDALRGGKHRGSSFAMQMTGDVGVCVRLESPV